MQLRSGKSCTTYTPTQPRRQDMVRNTNNTSSASVVNTNASVADQGVPNASVSAPLANPEAGNASSTMAVTMAEIGSNVLPPIPVMMEASVIPPPRSEELAFVTSGIPPVNASTPYAFSVPSPSSATNSNGRNFIPNSQYQFGMPFGFTLGQANQASTNFGFLGPGGQFVNQGTGVAGTSSTVATRQDRSQMFPNMSRNAPLYGGDGLSLNTLAGVRQQIDDSNHDMVNTLTQQMGAVITPLMMNTNNACNTLAKQMARLNQTLGVIAPRDGVDKNNMQ